MKKLPLILCAVVALMTSEVMGAPIRIDFTGVQNSDPFLHQGGENFLGISAKQSVSGWFVIDAVRGSDDFFKSDATIGQYLHAISTFGFQGVTQSAPFRGIGPYGAYSYYFIDVNRQNIQLYVGDLYAPPGDDPISTIFWITLEFKPGTLRNDHHNLAKLTTDDLTGVGNIGVNSQWDFHRYWNSLSTDLRGTQYHGYISSISISRIDAPSTVFLTVSVMALLLVGRRSVAAKVADSHARCARR